MIRRARLVSVLGIILAGSVGSLAVSQAWFELSLIGGGFESVPVTGIAAVPVALPMSLAVLALGLALALVGRVLRYVFAALGLAIGVVLMAVTVPVLAQRPISALASTVTERTGISGDVGVLIDTVTATVWGPVAVGAWVLLTVAAIFALATASRWPTGGRRYETGPRTAPTGATLNPVDSWDDLSHGHDPTTASDPR